MLPFSLVVLSLLVATPPAAFSKAVTISNVRPRTNVSGQIMDAHDGTYNLWTPNGPWYYYAMGYGTCKQGQDLCNSDNHCGYGYSWIGIWTSEDLSNGSWTLVREARDESWPQCTYFRVHTIYNVLTQRYVMWVNLNGCENDYAVGTSETPEGPFTFVHSVNAGRPNAHGGDFDIFVDDDGAAYLIYTAVSGGHTMAVERLSDDYLRSVAVSASPSNVSSGVFGNIFVEAPALFKRNGVYYALFGNCCCFCGHGSGIGVYTASHPLGQWSYNGNVGCLANTNLTKGCGCGMDHDITTDTLTGTASRGVASCNFYGDSLTKAQQNVVIQIPQPDGTTQYVWTGDRWQSAEDGVKAHDLQYWSVLKFQAQRNAGPDLPVQFSWEDTIEINV